MTDIDDTDSTDSSEHEQQIWTVPLVDLETGEGHDVEVEAATGMEAMRKAPDEYAVARQFVEEHTEIEVPSPSDLEGVPEPDLGVSDSDE